MVIGGTGVGWRCVAAAYCFGLTGARVALAPPIELDLVFDGKLQLVTAIFVAVTFVVARSFVIVELVDLANLPLDWLVARRAAFGPPVVVVAADELVAEHIAEHFGAAAVDMPIVFAFPLAVTFVVGLRLEPEPVHDSVRWANCWLGHRSHQDTQSSLQGRK